MSVLTRELAQTIVERTMGIIQRNINVMNEKGVIIGSGDTERINQPHDGAVKVIAKKEIVEINTANANENQGTKPGVNLPIYFNKEIVGVVGITGEPSEVRGFGLLIKMTAEMILEQAFLIEQIQWDQRLKEEVVYQLIRSDEITDPFFNQRAATLELDLTIPRIAILVEFRQTANEQMIRTTRQKIISTLGSLKEKEDLIASIQTNQIVLLKNVRLKNGKWEKEFLLNQLNAWIQPFQQQMDLKLSIGSFYDHYRDLSLSFNEAKKALEVGSILYPEQDIYCYDQMGFPILISQLPDVKKHPFIGHYKTILDNDKNGELRQSLVTFIETNGEIHKTAERLFIHRNTLHYRLDKIKELTGVDPKKLNGLIELYTSMLLYILKKY